MAKVPTPRRFTVTGRGKFPLDMLRYDRCYPATEPDVGVIEWSSWPRKREHFKVDLVKPDGGEPTVARWDSFGWKVVSALRPARR
jgi:hypothetical protein